MAVEQGQYRDVPTWMWYAPFEDGRRAGLTDYAAALYADLMWWGMHWGFPAAPITSGRRSSSRQREIRHRYDYLVSRGLRPREFGIYGRPAERSSHTIGEGFDLQRVSWMWIYGALAPYIGLRWGGTFTDPDEIHFDTGAHLTHV